MGEHITKRVTKAGSNEHKYVTSGNKRKIRGIWRCKTPFSKMEQVTNRVTGRPSAVKRCERKGYTATERKKVSQTTGKSVMSKKTVGTDLRAGIREKRRCVFPRDGER